MPGPRSAYVRWDAPSSITAPAADPQINTRRPLRGAGTGGHCQRQLLVIKGSENAFVTKALDLVVTQTKLTFENVFRAATKQRCRFAQLNRRVGHADRVGDRRHVHAKRM